MATTKELLNKVKIGLRETKIPDSQTSVTDSYELLLLQFLNLAKEEVEEAWDWEELRTTVTLTLTAGTETYELISTGASDITVPNTARLLYEKDEYGRFSQVFDVTDDTEDRLTVKEWEDLESLSLTDDDEQEEPFYIAFRRDSTNGNIVARVWPVPEKTRTLKIRFVIPQAELADDDLSTVLSVDDRAVWTKALLYAMEERGEELGRPYERASMNADHALTSAIARQQDDEDVTGYPV